MEIKLLNKISPVIYDELDAAKYSFSSDAENPDAIMVRSAAMHDLVFPESVKAIARCGAGVNNIPVDRCAEEGIVVFNTPGANANSVKELAVAALLLASRNIVGGISWSNTLAGNELGVAKAVEDMIHMTEPDLEVKTARAEGLRECRKLMTLAKAGKYKGYLLEGMACPGGCVAGAGTLLPVDLAAKVIDRYQKETEIVSPMDSSFGEMGKDMD